MPGVQGTVTSGAVTYKYMEVATGTARGISMTAQKGATGTITYKFQPNPHDDKWYNNNQAKFYLQAATAIAGATTIAGGVATFPAFDSEITVHKIDYTLIER